MKICCISDTHGRHSQLELDKYTADVLVHAGDFTKNESQTSIVLFLERFSEQHFKHKVLIAGNHEVTVEGNQAWFYKLLGRFPNITYLQDSSTIIDGIKFHGSPYSNEFYNWAFMEHEPTLKTIWNKIPDDTNVLITHGPAYGIHDLVKNTIGRDPHVGSTTLTERREELTQLKAHISGHIHEAYGTSLLSGVQNVCPCILNERYKVTNDPILITI